MGVVLSYAPDMMLFVQSSAAMSPYALKEARLYTPVRAGVVPLRTYPGFRAAKVGNWPAKLSQSSRSSRPSRENAPSSPCHRASPFT